MISFNAISCNILCVQMVKLSLFGTLRAVAKRLFLKKIYFRNTEVMSLVPLDVFWGKHNQF